MSDNEIHRGKCPNNKRILWYYKDGVCITEHITNKEITSNFLSPTTTPRKRPLRNPNDISLSRLLGVK